MNCLSIKTKFGWISAFETKGKIVRIKFGKHKNRSTSKQLEIYKNSLNKYLKKKKRFIKANYFIDGNTTQKKVWKELVNIKLGKTKTYGEIAKKFNLSPRHVGKICGQNKLLLSIPCHRVIKSDGSIGGFSSLGGIKLKKKLLNFESRWV